MLGWVLYLESNDIVHNVARIVCYVISGLDPALGFRGREPCIWMFCELELARVANTIIGIDD